MVGKTIAKLSDSIELNKLDYKLKREKSIMSLKFHCLLILRDIYKIILWLENAGNELNILPKELSNISKDVKKIPIHLKTRAENRISKIELSPFKLNKNFVDEIRNEEKYINDEIFREYFEYRNKSFLAKDLL